MPGSHKIRGLRAGIDDHLDGARPVGRRDTRAHAGAGLNRDGESGLPVRLVPRGHRLEFELLATLAEEPGVVVTRQQLLEEVWDPHWYGPTKTIDVHVASLRKKLGDPEWIETVRGVGLRLGNPS